MNNSLMQRSEPDCATLIRIATALDTTIDFLLGRTEHQGLPQTSLAGGLPDFIPHRGPDDQRPDPARWIPLHRSQYAVPQTPLSPEPVGWNRHETPHQPGNFTGNVTPSSWRPTA